MGAQHGQPWDSLVQVIPSVVERIYRGTPGLFGISLGDLIKHVVSRSLATREELERLWDSEGSVISPGCHFEIGHGVLVLSGQVDLVTVSLASGKALWEARATSNSKKAKPDRAQWNLALARGTEGFGDTMKAYEVFFEQAVVKQIVSDPNWVSRRDAAIVEILMGAQKPRPSAAGCRVCDFRDRCVDKHIPKPRVVKGTSPRGVPLGAVQLGGLVKGIL